MAKKKSNSNGSDWSAITRFCAFWSIVLAGVVFLVEAVIRLINYLPNVEITLNLGIFNAVVQVLFFLALIIPGWRFSKKCPKFVQIFYWVFVILILVFGVIHISSIF